MKTNIHFDWKKIGPHVVAIVLFFLWSFLYFAPVVLGEKDMGQGDVHSWFGAQQESRLCYEQTGERTDWSNVAFGGMPTVGSEGTNIYNKVFPRVMMGGLPVLNAGILFFYMIGVYILLCVLGCSSWLSFIGAIAYAFATYNVVIIDAGHVNKCWAMATMAPILAGVILCFKGKYLWGALLTLVFTGMHIMYSHQQITYYLLIMLVVLAIAYGIDAYRQKQMKTFWKGGVLALCMAIISLLPSLGGWLVTYDYSKDTMRGGAVLKQNPQGENEGTGLERDYAFQWSYGKMESMTLLIPQFYGGSSHYTMPDDSETNQLLRQSGQQASMLPMYWGDQPFTSGPVYVGAIICLLFVLGLFVVKGPLKWWLLVVTVISLVLSWGRHLAWLNDFLFDYLPLYNRFRTPSMALIIAELSMTVLAVLALKTLFSTPRQEVLRYKKDMLASVGIAGGLCLIFALFGKSMFSFEAAGDAQYPQILQDTLQADRASLLVSSAWRSLVFILLASAALWLYMKNKLKSMAAITILAVLVVVDMWHIDRKYVGEQNFSPKRAVRAVMPDAIDRAILEDPELKANPDPDYRVFNLTTSTFNDAKTSNFHKSIGGYSPMKLRRYQDIIDYHLSGVNGITMNVLNMLNTRYFIVPGSQGQPMVQKNPEALGHAWFVDSVRWVDSPDEEIVALYDFDPARTAVIDKVWRGKAGLEAAVYPDDSASWVRLTYYQPNHLKYEYASSVERPLVFAEVYHRTWRAFVDGEEVPLYQVNYILRGVTAPAGKHVVELKCRNKIKAASGWMTNTGSIINGLLILALIALLIWNPQSRKSAVEAGMEAEQAATGKE